MSKNQIIAEIAQKRAFLEFSPSLPDNDVLADEDQVEEWWESLEGDAKVVMAHYILLGHCAYTGAKGD